MDNDEPQEWYKLIRRKLSHAQFFNRVYRYPWEESTYYTRFSKLRESEYRRLYENSWPDYREETQQQKAFREYDEREAAHRQEAIEQYFREWPL